MAKAHRPPLTRRSKHWHRSGNGQRVLIRYGVRVRSGTGGQRTRSAITANPVGGRYYTWGGIYR